MIEDKYMKEAFNKAMKKESKEDALAFLWVALTHAAINEEDIEWAKEQLKNEFKIVKLPERGIPNKVI